MDVSDSSGVLREEREQEALVLEVELEFDLEGEVCISALIFERGEIERDGLAAIFVLLFRVVKKGGLFVRFRCYGGVGL
jgi:hypothetical protein